MNALSKIIEHYNNAVEKHPHFADKLITPSTVRAAKMKLAGIRVQLEYEKKLGTVWAEDVMLCELWEVMEAYSGGRHADAINEIYDVIAVLLRMRNMIAAEMDDGESDREEAETEGWTK